MIDGDGGTPLTATLWVLFYGISLLAASHFAPKSIQWLGRAFFVAGACALLAAALAFDHWRGTNQPAIAHLIMGLTFGALSPHLRRLHLAAPGAAAAKP